MKLFQCVQTFYRMLGVYPPQHGQISALNPKNLLIICNLAQGFMLIGAFALFRAKTVREFGDCYYTSTTSLSHSIYVSIHIWKMAKILKLIERFERIIQKSELKFRTILVKSKNLWERGIRVQNTGFARPWQIPENIVPAG